MMIYKSLQNLGIDLDAETGHLFYQKTFKPLKINLSIILVRHGETYGNCGQSTKEGNIDHRLVELNIKNKENRIYQGRVDKNINQLTLFGKEQAEKASLILEKEFLGKGWVPDMIFHSPLSRAKETGEIFVKRNKLEDCYFVNEEIAEMSFGQWENRRICDMESTSLCHSFYRTQNAFIKESGIDCHGHYQEAESFCEVLLRAHETLLTLEKKFPGLNLILFSHAMFGAACAILFGLGKIVENGHYLAFDGKDHNGISYALPHARPFLICQKK